jgi:hypothetical protein
MVELFPAIARSPHRARTAQGEQRKTGSRKGVKQMKVAASEAVVPMLSVHKFG